MSCNCNKTVYKIEKSYGDDEYYSSETLMFKRALRIWLTDTRKDYTNNPYHITVEDLLEELEELEGLINEGYIDDYLYLKKCFVKNEIEIPD